MHTLVKVSADELKNVTFQTFDVCNLNSKAKSENYKHLVSTQAYTALLTHTYYSVRGAASFFLFYSAD